MVRLALRYLLEEPGIGARTGGRLAAKVQRSRAERRLQSLSLIWEWSSLRLQKRHDQSDHNVGAVRREGGVVLGKAAGSLD